MVEKLPSPPRWKSVIVDIPGGSMVTEAERTLFYREVPECWEYKFGNPTYNKSFEVVPRKTYSKIEGQEEDSGEPGDLQSQAEETRERLYDEIASGDWMNKMQVSL